MNQLAEKYSALRIRIPMTENHMKIMCETVGNESSCDIASHANRTVGIRHPSNCRTQRIGSLIDVPISPNLRADGPGLGESESPVDPETQSDQAVRANPRFSVFLLLLEVQILTVIESTCDFRADPIPIAVFSTSNLQSNRLSPH